MCPQRSILSLEKQIIKNKCVCSLLPNIKPTTTHEGRDGNRPRVLAMVTRENLVVVFGRA